MVQLHAWCSRGLNQRRRVAEREWGSATPAEAAAGRGSSKQAAAARARTTRARPGPWTHCTLRSEAARTCPLSAQGWAPAAANPAPSRVKHAGGHWNRDRHGLHRTLPPQKVASSRRVQFSVAPIRLTQDCKDPTISRISLLIRTVCLGVPGAARYLALGGVGLDVRAALGLQLLLAHVGDRPRLRRHRAPAELLARGAALGAGHSVRLAMQPGVYVTT